MRRIVAAGLLAVVTLSACAPQTARQPATAPSAGVEDPCLDARYVEMKQRPLEELTEREYAYFLQRDKACTEYVQAAPQREMAVEAKKANHALGRWAVFSLFLGGLSYFFYSGYGDP